MLKDLKTNYSGGEFSPRMFGRVDLSDKYSGGCLLVDNYVPLPQGGLIRRPGTRFLAELDVSKDYRLVAYTPSADLSYLLVFSHESLDIYRSRDVVSAYGDFLSTIGPPLQTLASPFKSANLDQLRWTPAKTEDGEYVCVFTDGVEVPQELYYVQDDDPPFTLGDIPFTSHAFRDVDSSSNTLTLTEEEWVMKLVSSNATEFDGLTATYVEWRKDNEWALGRVLSTTTTPPAPADPAGNVCYVEPVTAIVRDLDEAARMVVLDRAAGGTDIPTGKRHVRSDTLVFNYNLEDAFIRVKSSYQHIRTSSATGSDYALDGAKHGTTMWLKIEEYLGTKDYPIDYIPVPTREKVTVGSTYRILKNSINVSVSAPVDNGTILWNDAFVYSNIGDSFAIQNHFKFNASSGELANLSTQKVFDVVQCGLEVPYYSCTGNVVVSGEYETEGHTGKLVSEQEIYAFDGASGIVEGQYILAEHGDKNWVLYHIDSIVSATEAMVTLRAGDLKREDSSSEIINGGQTSSYRVSEWTYGNYPRAVAWYERRLVFAGCASAPETLWLSRVSDVYDFRTIDEDGDVTDDAGITYPLAGKTMNKIVSVVSGPALLVGTESAVWQMRKSYEGEAITPSNISITEETADGCYGEPVRIGSTVIMIALPRQSLLELVYSYEINGFDAQNLNLLADHLFLGERIKRICYQHRPYTLIWAVTEAGKLFSLTYNKKQGTYAWARHTTQGKVKDCVLLQNPTDLSGYDRVVFLVERNGHLTLELLEEFYERDDTAHNKGYNFLDCCVRGYPPYILQQPVSFTGDYMEAHDFYFKVDGIPLEYQWYKDDVAIPDEDSATLSLPAVTAADAGVYKCRAWNNWGEVWSDEVVCDSYPPALTLDPVGTGYYLNPEGTFALSVAGTGSSPETFTYTWYKDGEALAPVTTATNLFPATEANAGEYYCVFASQWGSDTSATVVAGVIEDWDGVQDDELETVTAERDNGLACDISYPVASVTDGYIADPQTEGMACDLTFDVYAIGPTIIADPQTEAMTCDLTFSVEVTSE